MRLKTISSVTLSIALAVGGIVAACHNDVPEPTLPRPIAPEVTREGPKPPVIDPSQAPPSADAGVEEADTSASFFRHARRGERAPSPRVAHAPEDAGVSDVFDLPPVVDSDIDFYFDAGKPLN